MISGIKIRIQGAELHAHLSKRAEHHRERAEYCSKQVDSLKQEGAPRPDPIRSIRDFRQDPLSSLEESAKEHADKYGYFKFLADHLVVEETYELDEHDLVKIEIVNRYL